MTVRIMTVQPWPEIADEIHKKFGYLKGGDYGVSGDVLMDLVVAGYNLSITQTKKPGPYSHTSAISTPVLHIGATGPQSKLSDLLKR